MPNTPPELVAAGTRPERRADRRAKLDRPVLVDSEVASRPGRALEVSRGGMSIETELELAPGEIVGVYFELPIGYAVEARAVVTRIELNRIALRFVEMDHEAEVALRSFCRISGLHSIAKVG